LTITRVPSLRIYRDQKTRKIIRGTYEYGTPMPMMPDEFGKMIAEDTEKWAKVIRAANIKPE